MACEMQTAQTVSIRSPNRQLHFDDPQLLCQFKTDLDFRFGIAIVYLLTGVWSCSLSSRSRTPSAMAETAPAPAATPATNAPSAPANGATAGAQNTPADQNSTSRGLPYYEKLRRELRDTIAHKRAMDRSMVSASQANSQSPVKSFSHGLAHAQRCDIPCQLVSCVYQGDNVDIHD